MQSTDSQYVTSEQVLELLQTFAQNLPTRAELTQFATREDILNLRQVILATVAENPGTIAAPTEKQLFLQRLRTQITENERAIESLFRELASNKTILTELKAEIKNLATDLVSTQKTILELRQQLQAVNTTITSNQQELTEMLHNVDANTRVLGKLALVTNELNNQMQELAKNTDIAAFRSEMIQRFDNLMQRFEIYDHEQISLKAGLKRMEKIQKEEFNRNDLQDAALQNQQEKMAQFEQRLREAVG